MTTVKEQAAQLVDHLPDHASWDDLMYQIYVRQKSAADRPAPDSRDHGKTASTEVNPATEGTFSQRWRGKFVPADRDDALYEALAKRYL